MSRIYLRLTHIYEYAKGNPNSRNMNEGEEVLKSGQIVMVGCTEKTSTKVHILSLVLQTSALSSYPHTIKGRLGILNCSAIIEEMQCSCKAGLSGICKHVVAVLLYIERNDIMELEDLSCTDIKCAWTSRKTDIQEDFAAAPTSTFCCVHKTTVESIESNDEIENLFEELCSLNPNSAISKHVQGRNTQMPDENQQLVVEHFTNDIIQEILNNEILQKVGTVSLAEMKPCCKSIFESLAVANPGELCRETFQCREAWKKARELRISGSRIYGIYTYTKNVTPDWKQKSNKFFWPNEFTNKFVRHGIVHEQLARETYEHNLNVKVLQCGFIVHPEHRWIGYSPDGLILGLNGPEKLIEIKCVYIGKTKPITECLSSLTFLDKHGSIKKKHTYYGQIQLGMLLCNVKTCDFIIFATFDKSTHVLTIPFDEKFAVEMFTVVQGAYIKYMLHHICVRKNNEQG